MYLPSLQSRATLALNCLTRHVDVSRGRLPWFYTRLSDRPLSATLAIWSYGDGLGRSVDALGLLRCMTGTLSTPPHPEDAQMLSTLLSLLHPDDGLSWCPPAPWTLPHAHTRAAWLQQGTLLALTTWLQLTGDPKLKSAAERNIAGQLKMATPRDHYLTFPGDTYTKEDGWSPLSTDPYHPPSVFYTSATMPLLRYYRLTRHDPALTLASGLLDWALHDHQGGTTLFDRGHFHCQSRVLTSLLLRYTITHDNADLDLAEHLYKKAKSLGTQSGWFPEQINNPEHNRSNLSETCCLTDMLESAILLAQHRDPAYYDDVERYARNHLLAHQITTTDWYAHTTYVPRDKHVLGFNNEKGSAEGTFTSDTLKQTILGGFAGWGAVTSTSDDSMFSNTNQHCCNAAGARALYDAWRYAATDDGTTLTLHCHLHRTSRAATVTLEESPTTATLRLQITEPRQVKIRLPHWLSPDTLTTEKNTQPHPHSLDKTYLTLGPTTPGDTLTLRYPLPTSTTTEHIAPGPFTFNWRGHTVTSATPVQKLDPLFTEARFSPTAPNLNIPHPKEIDSL